MMQLLNTIGDQTNVFVISHKGDQLFDKFRGQIKFEKETKLFGDVMMELLPIDPPYVEGSTYGV